MSVGSGHIFIKMPVIDFNGAAHHEMYYFTVNLIKFADIGRIEAAYQFLNK